MRNFLNGHTETFQASQHMDRRLLKTESNVDEENIQDPPKIRFTGGQVSRCTFTKEHYPSHRLCILHGSPLKHFMGWSV